jgi:hypothetical protein
MQKQLTILVLVLAIHFAAGQTIRNFVASSQNIPGLTLQSHSIKCYQRKFISQAGNIQLTFNYQVSSNSALTKSALVVTIDGVEISRIFPHESGRTVTVTRNLGAGQHVLAFCTIGCTTEPQH